MRISQSRFRRCSEKQTLQRSVWAAAPADARRARWTMNGGKCECGRKTHLPALQSNAPVPHARNSRQVRGRYRSLVNRLQRRHFELARALTTNLGDQPSTNSTVILSAAVSVSPSLASGNAPLSHSARQLDFVLPGHLHTSAQTGQLNPSCSLQLPLVGQNPLSSHHRRDL